MTGRESPPPTLDPKRNFFLTPEGRPSHLPTRIAPPSLLVATRQQTSTDLRDAFERTRGELQRAIGEPYFAGDGFILYNGDSQHYLKRLADDGFAAPLVVTSPPYNIGKSYESPMDIEAYVDWCTAWLKQVHRATSPSGSFWLNLGYLEVPGKGLCIPLPYLLWNRTDFYMLQEIVWQYGAGVTTKSRFCPRNEKWLFYVRDSERYVFNLDAVRDPNVKYPNQKKNGKLRCNPLGKNPSDVWEYAKVTTGARRSSKERTAHPAQFPLGIIDRIVRVSSNLGDVVVDPFSGSASTGIAAVGNGRIYVGFELREDYCALSVERFQRFLSERRAGAIQRPLFSAFEESHRDAKS